MKTVRFAELVAKAGRPEPHQLWSAPGRDPLLQRALKEHRVLTIHQENVGAKRDFGAVGFHEEPHVQFVIFPKSIREFEGRRVIGINYDLLARPAVMVSRSRAARGRRASPPRGPAGTQAPDGTDAAAAEAASAPRPRRPAGAAAEAKRLPRGSGGGGPPGQRAEAAPPPAASPTGSGGAPGGEPAPVTGVAPGGRTRAPSKRTAAAGALGSKVVREITRALQELKAGRTVAAYERLQHLLAARSHAAPG